MMLSALVLTATACGTLDYAWAPQKFDMAKRAPDDAIIVVSGGAAQKCISAATSMTLLSVFRLRPGRYQLYPYVSNPYISVSRRPKAEFIANAGEVVYLGEFYAVQGCGPGESLIEIRDMERRDITLLKARNPAFESVEVVKRLAEFNGLVSPAE